MIDRALTRSGSAASKPSTIMRAKVRVLVEIFLVESNSSNETSRSRCAPCTARCASAKELILTSRPPRSERCSRFAITDGIRARCRSAYVASASPWMNSAPSSTGMPRPGIWRVQQRPPTRFRASRMTTERPARESTSAAARPAAPAPTIRTSKSRTPSPCVLLRLHSRIGGDLAPDADLFLDLDEELLRRAARRRDAVVLQLVGGLLHLQRLVRLGVDAVDDRLWQA